MADVKNTAGNMAVPSHSVTFWIDQLRSTDQGEYHEAAKKIWTRYIEALLTVARKQLPDMVRKREDEEDVVQSVFATFCERYREKDFVVNDRDDLWKLLVAITENKAHNVRIHHTRHRRDVRREHGAGNGGDPLPPLKEFEMHGPTPEEAAIIVEEMRLQLNRLDLSLQKVAVWKLQGYTNSEIADPGKMNCAVRTVERKLQLIRQIWEHDRSNQPPITA